MKPRTNTTTIPKRTWLARSLAALLAASALAVAPHANARFFVSVNIAPPVLPIYVQPPIPAPGYIWTPGYWAYDAVDGYYWVPGTWVLPPYAGALWTPGYWGWSNNVYVYNPGYWGLHVGYYGGINYGFGYTGVGYYGGYWGHGHFYYNSAANRFGGVHITNVYNKTVINNTDNHYSYNGPGGVEHRPTSTELAYSHERRTAPIAAQVRQQTVASHNESLRASENHGTPPIMATPKAGVFERADVNSAAETNRTEGRQVVESRANQRASTTEQTAATERATAERNRATEERAEASQKLASRRATEENERQASERAAQQRTEANERQASERAAQQRTEANARQASERAAQRRTDEAERQASERATEQRTEATERAQEQRRDAAAAREAARNRANREAAASRRVAQQQSVHVNQRPAPRPPQQVRAQTAPRPASATRTEAPRQASAQRRQSGERPRDNGG